MISKITILFYSSLFFFSSTFDVHDEIFLRFNRVLQYDIICLCKAIDVLHINTEDKQSKSCLQNNIEGNIKLTKLIKAADWQKYNKEKMANNKYLIRKEKTKYRRHINKNVFVESWSDFHIYEQARKYILNENWYIKWI